MKKEWINPITIVQKFAANEYVAACGDSGTVYKFTCDAGGGVSGSVYEETNGIEGFQKEWEWIQTGEYKYQGYWQKPDDYRSSYHACGTTHEADSDSGFINGYYVVGDKVTPVIIWTANNTNTHCTTNLDMNSWQTAKS